MAPCGAGRKPRGALLPAHKRQRARGMLGHHIPLTMRSDFEYVTRHLREAPASAAGWQAKRR